MRSDLAGLAWLLPLLAALTACGKGGAAIPDVEDQPRLGRVERADLPDVVPAYGIAEDGGAPRFVVNIEAADSARVHAGQRATVAYSTQAVACRVARILRGVSAETGQAVAWLSPEGRSAVAANDFVTARIEVGLRRGVLSVPAEAVMIQGGRTLVIRADEAKDGKTSYAPAPVITGIQSGGKVEIASGLKAGQAIVVSGGIGLLNPDFKAMGD